MTEFAVCQKADYPFGERLARKKENISRFKRAPVEFSEILSRLLCEKEAKRKEQENKNGKSSNEK
nr:hypothetical protein [Marseillevirus cajuinensis]